MEQQTPENLREFKDELLQSDILRYKEYGLVFGQAAHTIDLLMRENEKLREFVGDVLALPELDCISGDVDVLLNKAIELDKASIVK